MATYRIEYLQFDIYFQKARQKTYDQTRKTYSHWSNRADRLRCDFNYHCGNLADYDDAAQHIKAPAVFRSCSYNTGASQQQR
jgi:hypothetical protein